MSQFVNKGIEQSFVHVSNVSNVSSGSKSSAPYKLACVKGVFNTSFVPAEPIKQKINLNGVWYKKGIMGTIYKIIRIKADIEGNNDERKVFRLNAKAARDQNTPMLKATAPGRDPIFLKEDNNLKDSSKEEYDQKYSTPTPVEATPLKVRKRRGAAWEICVGDTIQFYNRVLTRVYHGSGVKYRNMDVAGEVVMVTPFFFSLREPNNPYGKKYFYESCKKFKVNLAIDTIFKNLVDGFFPNMDAKLKEERDELVLIGML
tara:strand:- start:994 stop:1770 length:777 start_codon:yes stop_codon:yes gene_type:complete